MISLFRCHEGPDVLKEQCMDRMKVPLYPLMDVDAMFNLADLIG